MRLHVDRTACDGRGTCVELLPELMNSDPWGYPIVHHDEVGAGVERYAKRAVTLCPRLALKLVE